MRVAAYCRVSTDREDQANSFESQQEYFRDYIERQLDWELHDIYADEGITGTSTKKRAAFKRMINDARLGRFDCIITKEVSRFSRNVLDTISYTRDLKRLGVGVIFMNDGINTLEPDAELRLSIMGSIAQEESRRTSSRVKWGQTRRMEKGVVFGRSLLGYDVQEGRMTINLEGAEIVRQIFHKYVREQKGTSTIAKELREAGYKTMTGNNKWKNTVLLKILRNEKYCGDLKQKKTITLDYLTHQKKYNHGEETFVFLKNHHEPIIDRELWEEAQKEIIRRGLGRGYTGGHGKRYPLSGKIKCSKCQKSFVSRVRRRTDGSTYRTWRCGTAAAEGKQCTNIAGNQVGCDTGYQIRDEIGVEMIRKSMEMLQMDRSAIISEITHIAMTVVQREDSNEQIERKSLQKKLRCVEEKKNRVLDAFFMQAISEEDMKRMNTLYSKEITELNTRYAAALKRENQFRESVDLETELRKEITEIVMGQTVADEFYGNLVERIVASPDRCMEVSLKYLPVKWFYCFKS